MRNGEEMIKVKRYKNTLLVISYFMLLVSCNIVKSNPSLKTENVEDVINQYWTSSFNADAEAVKEMTALVSDDFLKPCIEVSKKVEENNLVEILSNKANEDEITKERKIKELEACKKMEECRKANEFIDSLKKFDSEIPEYVQIFSSYIFVNKIQPSRIRIQSKKFYQNESIVYAKIVNDREEFDEISQHNPVFFLKKKDDSWKIISISTPDFDYQYAKPRPVCK
jgi:hypothetical protein